MYSGEIVYLYTIRVTCVSSTSSNDLHLYVKKKEKIMKKLYHSVPKCHQLNYALKLIRN